MNLVASVKQHKYAENPKNIQSKFRISCIDDQKIIKSKFRVSCFETTNPKDKSKVENSINGDLICKSGCFLNTAE
jgi:hypothetical protein